MGRPDPYVYRGTSVLINRPGIQDGNTLRGFVAFEVSARALEQAARPVAPTLDLNHVKGLHQRLYHNVFEWAGEFRAGVLHPERPEERSFRGVPRDGLLAFGKQALESIRASFAEPTRNPEHFAEKMALAYSKLDHWSPFRVGNEQVLGLFSSQLAESIGYELDWRRMNIASFDRARLAALSDDLPKLAAEFGKMALPPRALHLVRSEPSGVAAPAPESASGDAYRYPETQVMRNIPGIQDRKLFAAYRETELKARAYDVPRRESGFGLDVEGLRDIHRGLNRNIYYWAGELDQAPANPKAYAAGFAASAASLQRLSHFIESGAESRPQLIGHLAASSAAIDAWTPFRDGSRETLRIFTDHAIQRAQYLTDYHRTSPERMDEALKLAHRGNLVLLHNEFEKIISPMQVRESTPDLEHKTPELALVRHPEMQNAVNTLQKARDTLAAGPAFSSER